MDADEAPVLLSKSSFAGAATLKGALKEGVQLLAWLSLFNAIPFFCVSHSVRQLLTALVSADVSFDVSLDGAGLSEPGAEAEAAEGRRRALRSRAVLPVTAACGPLKMYIWIPPRDLPVKRDVVNRSLQRLLPCVNWTDCGQIRINCRNNVDLVHPEAHGMIGALCNHDALLLLEGVEGFRDLSQLTLTILQVACLRPEAAFPQVRRLKLLCRDSHLSAEALARLPQAFPALERLHLEAVPATLLSVCGGGLAAPSDLRLSLYEDFKERQANIFVASHLLTLPFTWAGSYFRNVARLQMSELTEAYGGRSLEQLATLMRSLPHLRRLGTVSVKTAQLFDIVREGCALEELVLVADLQELPSLFRSLVALEHQKRRLPLVRLAVHLVATDGAPQPSLGVESALVAAWYHLAADHLRDGGYVAFSVGQHEILESAPLQLPWFAPGLFALDAAEYRGSRLPLSTALSRPLPFHSVETVSRPRGTLITGSMRPSNDEDLPPQFGWSVEGLRGQSKARELEPRAESKEPRSSVLGGSMHPLSRSGSKHRAGSRAHVGKVPWLKKELSLSKAVEVLINSDE